MPSSEPADQIYRFGEFQLLASDRILLRDTERVPQAPRVFNLLLVLVENAGRLVTKETLMTEIWADSFVEGGNLNQTVSRLRSLVKRLRRTVSRSFPFEPETVNPERRLTFRSRYDVQPAFSPEEHASRSSATPTATRRPT